MSNEYTYNFEYPKVRTPMTNDEHMKVVVNLLGGYQISDSTMEAVAQALSDAEKKGRDVGKGWVEKSIYDDAYSKGLLRASEIAERLIKELKGHEHIGGVAYEIVEAIRKEANDKQ